MYFEKILSTYPVSKASFKAASADFPTTGTPPTDEIRSPSSDQGRPIVVDPSILGFVRPGRGRSDILGLVRGQGVGPES